MFFLHLAIVDYFFTNKFSNIYSFIYFSIFLITKVMALLTFVKYL